MGSLQGDFFMNDILGNQYRGKFDDGKFISNTSSINDFNIEMLESFYDRLFGTDILGKRKELLEF